MSGLEHKTTIRLPKELHTAAKIKAVQLGRPLSAIIRELLEKWIEEDPPKDEQVKTPQEILDELPELRESEITAILIRRRSQQDP